jgi:hypothetical protein
MSDSRSPNNTNKSEPPINTPQNSTSEKDETQKKQKLDVSNETSSSIAETAPQLANNPITNTQQPGSSTPISQKQISLQGMFIPRPVATKRKSETNLAKPTSELASRVSSTSSSPRVPSSNTLISQLLSSPNSKIDKTESESPGFLAFETAYSQLGKIAKEIAFLGDKDNKQDKEIYAISYGFILMSAAISKIKQFQSSNYEKNLKILEKEYGFDSNMHSLKDTLQNIENIRVLLADHFIRIPHAKFESLFNLQDDLRRLSVLAIKNSNVRTDYDTGMCPQINEMAKEADKIKAHSVSYIDRFSYIISSLKRIQNIKAEVGQENNPINLYAVAMLYVISGTCAREIVRSKEDHKHSFENDEDSQKLSDSLAELNVIRDRLAHNNGLSDPEKLKQQFVEISDAELVNKFTSQISTIERILKKTYAEKSIIAPPVVIPNSEASTDEKTSTIR